MVQKLAGTAVLAAFLCATAYGAEVTGKIVKVDDAAHKITLKAKDDKETEYVVAKDCKMPKGKDGQKEITLKDLAKYLDKAKDKGKDKGKGNMSIKATTDKKDGREVITKIEFDGRKKSKDK